MFLEKGRDVFLLKDATFFSKDQDIFFGDRDALWKKAIMLFLKGPDPFSTLSPVTNTATIRIRKLRLASYTK